MKLKVEIKGEMKEIEFPDITPHPEQLIFIKDELTKEEIMDLISMAEIFYANQRSWLRFNYRAYNHDKSNVSQFCYKTNNEKYTENIRGHKNDILWRYGEFYGDEKVYLRKFLYYKKDEVLNTVSEKLKRSNYWHNFLKCPGKRKSMLITEPLSTIVVNEIEKLIKENE